MSTRPLPARVFYNVLKFLIRLVLVTIFGFRCQGRRNVPREGALLVCANHQSVLDPPVIGSVFDRRLNYLARRTLFRFPPFRWLFQTLDAIPIERDGMGMAGLKESLRRLKRGEAVLIFPEGTRTHDGEVGSLKPGFCVLARRSEVTVLPVAVDGAYQAWPRTARTPRRTPIAVVIEEPLLPETVQALDDRHLVEEVERRIRRAHARARAARRLMSSAERD